MRPAGNGADVGKPGGRRKGKAERIPSDTSDAPRELNCDLLDRAQLVFTDPPYNVPVNGHVMGKGQIRHREFAMATGEMDRPGFTAFLSTVFERLVAHTVDGSIHFICMDWRHMDEILAAGHAHYTELKNLIVWVKDNGGMGTFYRSRHELVFAFKNGNAPQVNSFELGQHGRYRTNVWNYRGMNSPSRTSRAELALHPTVKPVAMLADAMRDSSERGGLVLDAFCGSGSVLIAAHKTGRRARAIEIDPIYCDTAIRRWQTFAKDDALLLATSETFDEVTARRTTEAKADSTIDTPVKKDGKAETPDVAGDEINSAYPVGQIASARGRSPWARATDLSGENGTDADRQR